MGGAVVVAVLAVIVVEVVVVVGEVVVVLVVVVCLFVVLLLIRLSAVITVVAARDTEFRLAMSSSVPWRISWADSGESKEIKDEKRLPLVQCEIWCFERIKSPN